MLNCTVWSVAGDERRVAIQGQSIVLPCKIDPGGDVKASLPILNISVVNVTIQGECFLFL